MAADVDQTPLLDNPVLFAWIIRYHSSMDRDVLAHLPIVLAVAQRRGFAAAAKQLGMTPSNVSHAVRLVEDRLGTPLFARSTRSVALTEAGEALLAQLAPAIDDMDRAWESQRAQRQAWRVAPHRHSPRGPAHPRALHRRDGAALSGGDDRAFHR
jgi:DNA-binding transcriptional LysR family regulator